MERLSDSPFFILGCDRSGTTLLRIMLIQSMEIHIPGETYFLPFLREHERSYGDFTEVYQRWFFIRDLQTNRATSETSSFEAFDLTMQEAESALARAAPIKFPTASAVLFRASAQKHGKRYWGDKTPRHVFHIPLLGRMFPDAKFIHVIRDGRDVALSFMNAGWVKNRNFPKAARKWKERVEAGISGETTLEKDRYFELRYERLIIDPEQTLKDVCSWLGIAYDPNMLFFHRTQDSQIKNQSLHRMIGKPVDSSRAFAWKGQLSFVEVSDFEEMAGPLLDRLGYELVRPRIPVREQILRKLYKGSSAFIRKMWPLIKEKLRRFE